MSTPPPAGARTPTLHSEWLNHRDRLLKPSLNDVEFGAINEVLDHYHPHGPLRTFTTYFRSGLGKPMYVAHGQYFDLDHVMSRLLELPGLSTGFGGQVYGGGKGHDLFGTTASSVGEAVERVLGSLAYLTYMDRILNGSYRTLTGKGIPCLHPEEFPVFAPEQLATDPLYEAWTEDTELGWIAGHRLRSGEEVYVPAQLVMLFYLHGPDEPMIGLAPSGGLASHISRRDALWHGVLELFERDAVNLRWYGGVPLDRVVIDRPLKNRALRRLLETAGEQPGEIGFYLHNLDLHDYPVLTAVERDGWLRRYSYFAGGGVSDDTEEAMLSALTEYSQAERSLRISLATPDWEFTEAFGRQFAIGKDAQAADFTNYIQVIPFYGFEENRDRVSWFYDGGEEIPLSELPRRRAGEAPERRWDALMGLLAERGWDPIAFDFSLPQFRHTSLMKVVMPELSPPYPPQAPGLGNPRYGRVPFEAGRRERPLTFEDLNTNPLPYP
ncbi:YcaO-like family protein [Streptomyces peucetius]|uniref:YcaO-like family protein n=1 Tax=Streptomyces peucetius TaxID=1950 RepID=A0ABY6I0Z1_STRPE|nr:YcaO-like family protein [Streptomyces peucetius]UYQ60642.1 YcaO-like family protein [Streptomyces peucetius]